MRADGIATEPVTTGEGGARFDLAGVDDWHAQASAVTRARISRALEDRDATTAVVRLARQPKRATEAAEAQRRPAALKAPTVGRSSRAGTR